MKKASTPDRHLRAKIQLPNTDASHRFLDLLAEISDGTKATGAQQPEAHITEKILR